MVRLLRPLSRLLFLAVLTPWLFSCGEEDGLANDVEFSITPENPIASPADTSYVGNDGTIVTITGPWYLMVVNIENKNPDYTLVVDSIELVSRIRNGNASQESTTTISYDTTGCDPATSARTIYAEILPGEFFAGDGDCDATNDGASDTERWYIGSLPEGSNLNYFVEATLYGTFQDTTDFGDPIRGRVQKTVFFTTQ